MVGAKMCGALSSQKCVIMLLRNLSIAYGSAPYEDIKDSFQGEFNDSYIHGIVN